MRLHLHNIVKTYGDRVILKDIAFHLDKGECVRLVGPSGLGKSTLLEIAAGVTPPDSGHVVHNGRISMTFQDDALLPWANAEANLAYALACRPAQKDYIRTWLTRFDLPFTLHPAEMSGGMRRRLSLARAFAAQADILFLDEPFAFLDAIWRQHVADMIDAATQSGSAVLFSTHQSEEMPRSCRRSMTIDGHGGLTPC
ncbi:MAG: ABC transporter ATP-binding protein [Rhodospirillaceae bacterium]|nr:ABC transporter ATP-binding protein [Rhodospirillaceae bacterium]